MEEDIADVSRQAIECKELIIDDDAGGQQTIAQALADTARSFPARHQAHQAIECLLHEPEVAALMLDVFSE